MTTLTIIIIAIIWLITVCSAFMGGYKFGTAVGISVAVEHQTKNGKIDEREVLKSAIGILKGK